MRIRGLAVAGVLICGAAFAQPPGGSAYFGPKKEEAFTPVGVFGKPQAMPVLPPPADGGLFPDPVPLPPRKLWSGSGEIGANGSAGNSEVFNARVGLNADRKTADNLFHTDFLYALGKQSGGTVQNQAILNARDEILFAGSPWTLFTATNVEYDEFRLYHFRVGVYGGVGYVVLNDDDTLFKLRVGAGAVREIGGPKDRWVPEAVFGYDFKHKFTDRQSLLSNLDYYPRIDEFAQFRVRARAAYEVVIDPTTGTALRIGAQSRYDSDPGIGKKRNDVNYFATLAFHF